MPSLMAARWVGQNSGPIFCPLWTKVHQIKLACVVCNAIFRLTMSCCVPEIHVFAITHVAKLSEIAPKFGH